MNTEERIKAIGKEITRVALIDALGSILVGLGLYAKFVANGNAFHPLLNDGTVVNIMLGTGAVIIVWGGYKLFTLSRGKLSLKNECNL
ncbi:hypothetical protein [Oceanicoccus sagamiensis]|uniref:Uncharacterized protein n=1 Tax=Oceanicoccus sagamiensis TaxID=716816 RepID=A0A1X9N7H6_9GAMM|nr:hypothetical protein [Oceanicoccus sagamiensis]ARN74028.1 hypothetical protein BST96_07790 [Oceanicoccus sagamiensis]